MIIIGTNEDYQVLINHKWIITLNELKELIMKLKG